MEDGIIVFVNINTEEQTIRDYSDTNLEQQTDYVHTDKETDLPNY